MGLPAVEQSSPKKRRILAVDDDDMVRAALVRTLQSAGYEVRAANCAAQGLVMLKEGPSDVVISDHLMPEMTGLDFLRRVRDLYPSTLRIMLTGHAETSMAISAINQGEIYRFVTKPWDNTELKVMLHIAFEHLELEREHRELLAMVRSQAPLIRALRRKHPEIQLPPELLNF